MTDNEIVLPDFPGALFDEPDPRDHLYANWLSDHLGEDDIEKLVNQTPKVVSLDRKLFPPIFNQGNLGSCTAQESVAQYAGLLGKQGKDPLVLSRLQVYYAARQELGLPTNQDTGATGRACAKVLAKYGACPESMWTYTDAGTKFATMPTQACLNEGANHQLLEYLSIPSQQNSTVALIQQSLASGFAVGFSMTLYENFHPDANGKIPTPAGRVWGGHRILITGYKRRERIFEVRNSWSTAWGKDGYCFIGYDHMLNFGVDFWTFRTNE